MRPPRNQVVPASAAPAVAAPVAAARPGLVTRVVNWLNGPGEVKGPPAAVEGKAVASDIAGSGVAFVGPDTGNIIRIALGGYPYPDAERLTRDMAFVTSAYCYVAMRWRSTRAAEPPLMVVQETDQGEEWQPDHPLASLLDLPRPDVDMGELIGITQQYRDGTGGALWWAQKNVLGEQAMITPFSANEFRVKAVPPRIYGSYEVKVQGGDWKPIPDGDVVIHFRDPGPSGWHKHTSLVDVALAQLDLGHQVNRIARRFLDRAMFPGGVLSPDADWHPDTDEWNLWKEAVEAWYGGPANAGAPLALPGGTKFSRSAAVFSELLPEPILDRIEAVVGSVFGVPPIVLGWLSGMKNSPWSQMAAARRMAYEETIEPLWRDYERRIGRALLTKEEHAAKFYVRFDTLKVRAVQEDNERRSRVAKLNADTWRVNERRLFTGQEPLDETDERGDLIVGLIPKDSKYAKASGAAADTAPGAAAGGDAGKAAGSTTLQTLIFPKAKKWTAAAAAAWAKAHGFKAEVDETSTSFRLRQRDPGAFQTGSLRTICLTGAKEPGPDCRVAGVVGKLKGAKAIERDASKQALRDVTWLVFDVETKAAQAVWEITIAGYLRRLGDQVGAMASRTLRAHKSEAKQVDPESAAELRRQVLAALKAARPQLSALVRPLVLSTGGEAVEQAALRLGLTFAALEPGLAKYADEEADFLADAMGEATGRAVADTVQRGLMAGDDVGKLAKRLREDASFDRPRAKLVARTETTRAWNGAQRRSLSTFSEDSGRAVTKSWLSARDDRVREEHADLDDGTYIPIDDAFDNGLTEPGEPNCRCTLIYDVAGPDGQTTIEGEGAE